jgi:hypothetical protein
MKPLPAPPPSYSCLASWGPPALLAAQAASAAVGQLQMRRAQTPALLELQVWLGVDAVALVGLHSPVVPHNRHSLAGSVT